MASYTSQSELQPVPSSRTRTPMARLRAEEVIAVPDGRDPPVVVV